MGEMIKTTFCELFSRMCIHQVFNVRSLIKDLQEAFSNNPVVQDVLDC